MTSGQSSLICSFVVSTLLHLGGGVVLGVVFGGSQDVEVLPAFQVGEVSVEVYSEPATVASPETPETVALDEPIDEIDPVVEPEPEEAAGPEEEPGQSSVAAVEGVQIPLVSVSVIRPRYPLGSRLRGEEGVVLMRARIGVDGRAVKVDVTGSSGFSALDNAAVKSVMAARFIRPATSDEIEMDLPAFRFRLVE